jgi:hypothetical protein
MSVSLLRPRCNVPQIKCVYLDLSLMLPKCTVPKWLKQPICTAVAAPGLCPLGGDSTEGHKWSKGGAARSFGLVSRAARV